jgi:hypothetical protein
MENYIIPSKTGRFQFEIIPTINQLKRLYKDRLIGFEVIYSSRREPIVKPILKED